MFARIVGALLLCLSTTALAQSYPSRPVRIVVPFGPGGVTDVLARLVAAELQKDWGRPVVVENVSGATGMIGASQVAKAAPDGHTLMVTSNAHTINAGLRSQIPYDTVRDFTPLVLLAAAPNMLVVKSDSPYKTVADYVAAAKAKPGEINYAHSGVGTSLHIAGEQFAQITGTRFNHIPYAASNQSIQAVVSGQTMSSWSAVNSALPFMKDGRVRALAVAKETRTSLAPDVPTFAEQGVPGMKSETWLAAFAPAGLPQPIAQRLASEMRAIIERPEMKDRLVALGAEPVGTSLEKFDAQIRQEIEMYKAIVKAGNIKAE